MRKKHPDVVIDVKAIAKNIKCPPDLLKTIQRHEYATFVIDVKAHIQQDRKKFPAHKFTKSINNNVSSHKIAQTILREWLHDNPERRDMLGGTIRLELVRHTSNKLSLDRKNNKLPHFLSFEDMFANIRIVSLKLNTRYSLIQLFGDNTRLKIKSLVIEQRDIDVDVESQITAYTKLPKRGTKNLIYQLYDNCKKRNKNRHQQINAPFPKDQPSFEQFKKQFFRMLQKQQGKCAISQLILNFNFTGTQQFQISIDRIDPHDINYWNWENLQLVCVALNVTDCSRDKKYVAADDDEGAGMTSEWFMKYFDIV